MSNTSHSESDKSHCLGLLWKYHRRRKKEKELASTRPVGFAAGKEPTSSLFNAHKLNYQLNKFQTKSAAMDGHRTTLCEYPDYYLGAITAPAVNFYCFISLQGVKGGPPPPHRRSVTWEWERGRQAGRQPPCTCLPPCRVKKNQNSDNGIRRKRG